MTTRTLSRSAYMEFAKLRSAARYNLATSGMAAFPLRELGVSLEQLEINGPDNYGYGPLRQAIAHRYRVAEECVVTAAGTSMANYLAMAACVEPGDEVLIEQPTYALLLDTAHYLGLKVRRFLRPAELKFQVDLDDLKRNISERTKLIVLCNLHNPSGALLANDTLREIGRIANSAGARVLVDEVYLEMLWQSQPQSAVHLDPDVFISSNSLTKAYGLSGLRCGWVLASPELAERMWHINDLHGATPVFPGELLSVIAFSKLAEIAAQQKSVLDENRRMLREFLERQSILDYFWPEHGTVVFPRLRSGDVEKLCEQLKREYQISVVPGAFFEDRQRIRIGVGGATDDVRASLEQLRRALHELG
jgi:aspartate/methionine/tyrosine aminotransferase